MFDYAATREQMDDWLSQTRGLSLEDAMAVLCCDVKDFGFCEFKGVWRRRQMAGPAIAQYDGPAPSTGDGIEGVEMASGEVSVESGSTGSVSSAVMLNPDGTAQAYQPNLINENAYIFS